MFKKFVLMLCLPLFVTYCKTTEGNHATVAGVNDGGAGTDGNRRYARNGLQDATEGIRTALKNAAFAVYAIRSGIITGLMAKNVCSLRYVEKFSLDNARRLGAQYGSNIIVTANEIRAERVFDGLNLNLPGIKAEGKLSQFASSGREISPPSIALFHEENPRLGCALIARAK